MAVIIKAVSNLDSIVIPLEQGLRLLIGCLAQDFLKFYCHSIRTRIKTRL